MVTFKCQVIAKESFKVSIMVICKPALLAYCKLILSVSFQISTSKKYNIASCKVIFSYAYSKLQSNINKVLLIANCKLTVISSSKLQVASFCSGVSARMTPGGTAVFVGFIVVQLYNCKAAQLYSCTALQLYSCTVLQLYSCRVVQLYICTAVQLYSFTAVQLCLWSSLLYGQ